MFPYMSLFVADNYHQVVVLQQGVNQPTVGVWIYTRYQQTWVDDYLEAVRSCCSIFAR